MQDLPSPWEASVLLEKCPVRAPCPGVPGTADGVIWLCRLHLVLVLEESPSYNVDIFALKPFFFKENKKNLS